MSRYLIDYLIYQSQIRDIIVYVLLFVFVCMLSDKKFRIHSIVLIFISMCFLYKNKMYAKKRSQPHFYIETTGTIIGLPENGFKNSFGWGYDFYYEGVKYKGSLFSYGPRNLTDSVKIGDTFPIFFEKGNPENSVIDFYSDVK